MYNFMLLATAWGPRFGGINAFNTDFARGLAKVLGTSGQVYCGVLRPTAEDIDDADNDNVVLVNIDRSPEEHDKMDRAWAVEILETLAENHGKPFIHYWIGHDVTSAEAAKSGAKKSGTPNSIHESKSALIMHMDYAAYQAYKHLDGVEADKREQEQQRIFEEGNHYFANGPLLKRALSNFGGYSVTELVPGFPEIKPFRTTETFNAITFGRLDATSDRVKQGKLAVAAFGMHVKGIAENAMVTPPKGGSRIRVVGVSSKDNERKEDENTLSALYQSYSGRASNNLLIPYTNDRVRLFEHLRKSDVALMLSWHEGFGLTGWEAIAAEVPLIVSKNSGLWQLLDNVFGNNQAESYVKVVDVSGSGDRNNFSEHDVKKVANALDKIFANQHDSMLAATRLKRALINELGCKWEQTAVNFLKGLDIAELGELASGPNLPAPEKKNESADEVFEDTKFKLTSGPASPSSIDSTFDEHYDLKFKGAIDLPVDDNLLGREDLVKEHYHYLAQRHGGHLTISGQVGIGKTQIARAIARKAVSKGNQDFPAGCLWIDAERIEPEGIVEKVVLDLKVPKAYADLRMNGGENDNYRQWVGERKPLIIIDNLTIEKYDKWRDELIVGASGDFGNCSCILVFQENIASLGRTNIDGKHCNLVKLSKENCADQAHEYFTSLLPDNYLDDCKKQEISELLFDHRFLNGLPGLWRPVAKYMSESNFSVGDLKNQFLNRFPHLQSLFGEIDMSLSKWEREREREKSNSHYYALISSLYLHFLPEEISNHANASLNTDLEVTLRLVGDFLRKKAPDWNGIYRFDFHEFWNDVKNLNLENENISEYWHKSESQLKGIFERLVCIGLVEQHPKGYLFPNTLISLGYRVQSNLDFSEYQLIKLNTITDQNIPQDISSLKKLVEEWGQFDFDLTRKDYLTKRARTRMHLSNAFGKGGWHMLALEQAYKAKDEFTQVGNDRSRIKTEDQIIYLEAMVRQIPTSLNGKNSDETG